MDFGIGGDDLRFAAPAAAHDHHPHARPRHSPDDAGSGEALQPRQFRVAAERLARFGENVIRIGSGRQQNACDGSAS